MKSNDTLPARASWIERAFRTSCVPSKNSTSTPGNSFLKASMNFCATLDSCWSHQETVPSCLAASNSAAICGESLGTATPGFAAGGGVAVASAAAGAVVGLGAAAGAVVGAAAGAVVGAGAGAVVGLAGAAVGAAGVDWAHAASRPAPEANPSRCKNRRREVSWVTSGKTPLENARLMLLPHWTSSKKFPHFVAAHGCHANLLKPNVGLKIGPLRGTVW